MLTETCLDSPFVAAKAVHVSLERAGSAKHSWRYEGRRRCRKMLGLALVISAGLHAVVLFGFGRNKKPVPRQAEKSELIALTVTMPELTEEEPETPASEEDGRAPDLGSFAPVQSDRPQLPQLSDFVQQIDYSSLLPQPDLSGAKILTIPGHIGRGGKKIGEGLGNIFNLADLDRVPEPVLQMAPLYPPKLKKKGEEGIVRVEFVVDTQGRVVGAFVFESTNHGFDEATLATVAKWKFRPGTRGGRAVNTRMRVPISFSLNDGFEGPVMP